MPPHYPNLAVQTEYMTLPQREMLAVRVPWSLFSTIKFIEALVQQLICSCRGSRKWVRTANVLLAVPHRKGHLK